MKWADAFVLAAALLAAGCGGEDENGTHNGGQTNGSSGTNGQAVPKGTFTLKLPETAVSVAQGRRSVITLEIAPEGGFNQSVELAFDLPTGLSVEPQPASIKSGETGTTITIIAAADAAAGPTPVAVSATAESSDEPIFGQFDVEVIPVEEKDGGETPKDG